MWWALAIVVLGVYCGARSYGEPERRQAISRFMQWGGPIHVEDDAALAADHAGSDLVVAKAVPELDFNSGAADGAHGAAR